VFKGKVDYVKSTIRGNKRFAAAATDLRANVTQNNFSSRSWFCDAQALVFIFTNSKKQQQIVYLNDHKSLKKRTKISKAGRNLLRHNRVLAK